MTGSEIAERELATRPYRDDDREACLRVFESNVPRFFRPHEREEFEVFLEAPPGPYYVLVEPGGTVAGCGGYAVDENSAVADPCWGMVDRTRHGHGLGRVLTERRIEAIRDDGRARSIALHTSQHTARFYERMGFRTTRVRLHGYAPGLDRHDMVMEL